MNGAEFVEVGKTEKEMKKRNDDSFSIPSGNLTSGKEWYSL